MHRQSYLAKTSCLTAVVLLAVLAPSALAQDASEREPVGWTDVVPLPQSAEFEAAESLDAEVVRSTLASKEDKTDAELTELERAIVCCSDAIGVDHLAAGTGTRNAGYGTIRLRGAPPNARLIAAYLYWGGIEDAPPPTQDVNFEGRRVTGRLLGTAVGPCWGGGTFGLYRAVVSHLIPPEIDGDYRVDGFPSFLVDGRNPWGPNAISTRPLAEGSSLVALITHRNLSSSARTYFFHGPVQFSGPLTIDQALAPPLASSILKHTRIGADGQVGAGITPFGAAPQEDTFIGPVPGPLTQIKGVGAINTDSDWNGADGVPLNQLWDTHTSDVSGTIPAGSPSYRVQYVSRGDCLEAAVHVLGSL